VRGELASSEAARRFREAVGPRIPRGASIRLAGRTVELRLRSATVADARALLDELLAAARTTELAAARDAVSAP
jgi:hypothetical protein